MIEAIIIFSVVSISIFLIATYYGFKEIIEQNYDLSDSGTAIEEPIDKKLKTKTWNFK
ncbi:MAG: hypothetical protein ACPGWR_23345 [Ardenticatenaceae bacterium]